MPTLRPGCQVVPRWRQMMLPAIAASPPDFFSPRRRPALSRPLREDPPAFLCAIELALSNSDYLLHRFREGIISLFLALCGGFYRLFCGRFLGFGLYRLCFRTGFGLRGAFHFG